MQKLDLVHLDKEIKNLTKNFGGPYPYIKEDRKMPQPKNNIKTARDVKFTLNLKSIEENSFSSPAHNLAPNAPHWHNEKKEKIYVSKIFSDHGFPNRPTTATGCKSKNGDNTLEIHSEKGLPYGHDKDLIFVISSLAYKSKERELYFHSKAELLREIDKVPHSDTTKRLLESILRLRNTNFVFHDNVNKKPPFKFKILESVNPGNQSLTLTLTKEFFNHLTKKKTKFDKKTKKQSDSSPNVRVFDKRMLKELRNSRTALDTFTFTGLRAQGKTAKMNILDFMNQIQTGIQSAKQFAKKFKKTITNKITKAFKKIYNTDIPKDLFKIFPSGKGPRKSFTLEIRGGCQLIPSQTS